MYYAITVNNFQFLSIVPMVKSMEIPLDGYKSSAWHVAGHHRSMKHNQKLDCHMSDSLQLRAMCHPTRKQVSFQCWLQDTAYTIWINIKRIFFIGRGKSKKEAKRLAAHQMWQRLQDMPADNQDDAADEVSETDFTIMLKL